MKKTPSYCLKFIVAVMVALSMWSAQAFEHNRVVVNGQEYIDWSGATASSTIAILFLNGDNGSVVSTVYATGASGRVPVPAQPKSIIASVKQIAIQGQTFVEHTVTTGTQNPPTTPPTTPPPTTPPPTTPPLTTPPPTTPPPTTPPPTTPPPTTPPVNDVIVLDEFIKVVSNLVYIFNPREPGTPGGTLRGPTFYNGNIVSGALVSGYDVYQERAELVFDTSAIPANATILRAGLTLDVQSKVMNVPQDLNGHVSLYANRSDRGLPSLAQQVSYPTIQPGQKLTFNLNAAGLAQIQKGGSTRLVVRGGFDVSNQPLQGVLHGWNASYIIFHKAPINFWVEWK